MRASRRSCASAFFSAAALLVGCSRAPGDPPRAGADAAPATAAAAPLAYPPQLVQAGGGDAEAADEPVAVKSVGHTSFVLKVTLADGTVGAFKPRSKRTFGDRRYRGEIAAYRLAAALELGNVPSVTPRAFALASLKRACASVPGCGDQLDREAIPDSDGTVRGAFIRWINGYRVLPLEESTWRARWEPWLFDPRATVPREERSLASAISTLIAFDYLTANWDRWSGGNVARDGAAGELLFVDNDGAFYEHPPAEALARQLSLLRRVVRFSRGFVSALRRLDDAKLREVFGDEPPGEPLLAPPLVAAVEERRRLVIQIVDGRIARSGEHVALAFD
jgi:hypothetical protein